ncbi:MAG: hypothetical protein WD898_03745 [Candidatus Paceibacterota bacterium]
MADVGGLQLLPETRKKIEVKVPGQNRLLIMGVIVIVVVLALYFGLTFYKQSLESSIATLDTQLFELERSRDRELETNILNVQQQLSVVNPLLKSHLIWSDAFERIQNLTQPQVQYKSLNAEFNSRTIFINAVAANYTTVARQIAAFYSDDSIVDLDLSEARSLPSGVDFSIEVTFDPTKFLIQSE